MNLGERFSDPSNTIQVVVFAPTTIILSFQGVLSLEAMLL